VLLNDPTYVEASRLFATRILTEWSGDHATRIKWAWRQALQRPPRPDELDTALSLVTKHLSEYKNDADAAKKFLSVGMTPPSEKIDPAELAAWTHVGRLILNLHESITRS
jgi:hypothetical protein